MSDLSTYYPNEVSITLEKWGCYLITIDESIYGSCNGHLTSFYAVKKHPWWAFWRKDQLTNTMTHVRWRFERVEKKVEDDPEGWINTKRDLILNFGFDGRQITVEWVPEGEHEP